MYDKKSRRRSRQFGGAAIEFGLSIPVLLLAVAAGLGLGRALVVRHNFAEAVSFATRLETVRANGVPGAVQGGNIQAQINQRMPPGECSNVDVRAQVRPFNGVQAVDVVATCMVTPFWATGHAWGLFNVPNFVVNAAFPL